MDGLIRTNILSPTLRWCLTVAACGVFACGGDEQLVTREAPPGLPLEVALLRLPHERGSAQLYRADSLTPLEWKVNGVPAIARGLGTDVEDRMVYAVGTDGALIGLDLEFRRVRPFLNSAAGLTATDDGMVLGLDSTHHALRFSNRALTVFRVGVEGRESVRLVRSPGDNVVAFSPSEHVVQVLSEEGEVRRFDTPAGQFAATWFGDQLAVTTDSGVMVIDPSSARDTEFIDLGGTPTASVFSPSGHRLYVARARGDVLIFDRFSLDEIGSVPLPGATRDLRVDRSGRWLLARPETGDSVWLVDLVRREHVTTLASAWAIDLPVIAGGRVLVARDRRDVVSWDLTGTTLTERARLKDAADDVYLSVPWVPRGLLPDPEPPELAAGLPDSITDAIPILPDDTSGIPPIDPLVNGVREIYIQVNFSQNEGWARALAKQLRDTGFEARVLVGTGTEGGFRVVLGPYASREEADAVGRRLGRSYFIMPQGAVGT